jgi:hypothetical protein
MNIDSFANLVDIANGICSLLGTLPKTFNTVRSFITKNGFEIKTSDKEFDHLEGYLDYKKSKDERKRCEAILKKHNLPKTVGIMCKSEKDICFMPNKAIVDKNMNNLHLKSTDSTAELIIGGGFFAFNIKNNASNIAHQNIMCGTVIKHKGEIYLLRHPLGGSPYYLAKLDLFINGMIIELDDGFKVGLYY